VLFIGEDTAHQQGPICPPEIFRAFFVPRLRRFADLAHEYGAVCRMHSCGATRPLIPLFIDEIGLDILDAVQAEPIGMDPLGLKRDFGACLTFCGMFSLQRTFAHGTPDDCRLEAELLIEEIGHSGGYIFSPPNTFTEDTPIQNIIAAYEAAIQG
jgi:uroporphyrinogen decarboxylase